MQFNDEKELYDLIRNLSRGIKKHGIKKIIRSIKQLNIDSDNEIVYSIIDFVETSVCEKLGIPRAELFGFDTRGEITIARKLCILIIRKNTDISDDELGGHYNRTRQVVHNIEKEFKTLKGSPKKFQFDIDFLGIYNDLDEKTIQYSNELKERVKSVKKSKGDSKK